MRSGRSPTLFDPYGWDPDQGLDAAIALLGVRCARTAGGTAEEAEERLREASARGPVLVGPVDMGLLLHQPDTPTADGGDHFVVVLEVDGGGLPRPARSSLRDAPVADLLAAWEAKRVGYTDDPYVMRAGFVQERKVSAKEALRRALPDAERWLAGRHDRAGARSARCRRNRPVFPAAFVRFAVCGGGVGLVSSGVLMALSGRVPVALANAVVTVARAVLATELHARSTFGGAAPGGGRTWSRR